MKSFLLVEFLGVWTGDTAAQGSSFPVGQVGGVCCLRPNSTLVCFKDYGNDWVVEDATTSSKDENNIQLEISQDPR
jgi:hypothetical protein